MGEVAYTLELEERPERTEIRLGGAVRLADVPTLRAELAGQRGASAAVTLDLSGVEALDGGAAAVLAEFEQERAAAGGETEVRGLSAAIRPVLDLYRSRVPGETLQRAPRRQVLLDQIGTFTWEMLQQQKQVLEYLGSVYHAATKVVRRPRSVPWRDVPLLMERVGADGLPIVFLISLLIGLVTAFQAAVQLRSLGADIYVADAVALGMTRELGPLMTAIIVAGRSGAGFAAELGTMKVSEEIDALTTMGLSPQRFLVLPRIVALVCMVPLLTILSDLVGILGGLLIGTGQLGITINAYVTQTLGALDMWDVFGGVIKALSFGLLIGLIACERGLSTRGGAEGVGRSTTSAVVVILFWLVLADAGFAVLFYRFGI